MNTSIPKHQIYKWELPRLDQRTTICGMTGSGKTVMGSWLLSLSPFDRQPYIVIDYKYDPIFRDLDRIEEIDYKTVPRHPGLYVTHPVPEVDDQAISDLFWKIWQREKVGLYIDEYYSIPDGPSIKALLTQGRSKRIPIIGLTQRPAWITRFAFSEAEHVSIFHLSDSDDRKKVQRMTGINSDERLPEYHSRWFDVKRNANFLINPVEKPEIIQQRIHERLAPKRRFT